MANLVIGADLMDAGVGALVAIRRHNKAMADAEEMHEKQAFYTERDFPRYPMAAGAAIIAAGAVVLALGSVNDSGGASADIDLQVMYSFDGDAAEQLYQDYGTQENFTQNYILNDVRATAREVAGKYDTITMLTSRGEFTRGVQDALSEKWKGLGLTVESVSVQDVRYPDEITGKYSEAQAAEVEKDKAKNEQETARVEAETKKIKAQGEADANAILAQSLNDQVLRQHYIDTLGEIGKDGNLVVVPEGSQPIVGTSD